MLALAAAGSTGASCGGDGDGGGGPADAFLGTWIKSFDEPIAGEPDATGFTITCANANFTVLNGPRLVFPSIAFEHGVVTDLVETSGNCPLLNWDIDGSGKAATVPNPDPVIAEIPECIAELEYEDTAGNVLPALMWLHPGSDLKFSLLGTENSLGAPKAQLQGSAMVDLARLDATNMRFDTDLAMPCTYTGTDTYFRFTQP
jgi:hypothetical protein